MGDRYVNAIQYNAFQDELEKIALGRLLNPNRVRKALMYPREATAAFRASVRGSGGLGKFLKGVVKGDEFVALAKTKPRKRLVTEYQADLGVINRKLRALKNKPESFLRNLRVRGLKGQKETKIRQMRIASPRSELETWMDVLPGGYAAPGHRMPLNKLNIWQKLTKQNPGVRPEDLWARSVRAGSIAGPGYAAYRAFRD